MRALSSSGPLVPSLCLLFLLLVHQACDRAAPGAAGPEVRDSAGVQIIENSGYQWTEGSGWRLSATPAVDIGESESDPNYQLYNVVGALQLADGRIVVANSGSSELRFFAADGTFLSAAGRSGGGPGEFGELLWLRIYGDSLLAFDWSGFRLSVFDDQGTFVRGMTLPSLTGSGGFPAHLAPFADGSLLVAAELFRGRGGVMSTGVRRDTTLFMRCARGGALLDTLGSFPGGESYAVTEGEHVTGGPRALGRQGQTAVGPDGFYYGSSDSYEIGRYGPDGQLTQVIRLDRPSRAVSQQDVALYEEDQVAEWGGDEMARQAIRRMLASMPFPETLPAYGEFQLDEGGNLWVEDFRRPGEEITRWTVFDPAGTALGTVELPPRFEPYQIGTDYVLGRWRDELDIEHVQLYRLLKS